MDKTQKIRRPIYIAGGNKERGQSLQYEDREVYSIGVKSRAGKWDVSLFIDKTIGVALPENINAMTMRDSKTSAADEPDWTP